MSKLQSKSFLVLFVLNQYKGHK